MGKLLLTISILLLAAGCGREQSQNSTIQSTSELNGSNYTNQTPPSVPSIAPSATPSPTPTPTPTTSILSCQAVPKTSSQHDQTVACSGSNLGPYVSGYSLLNLVWDASFQMKCYQIGALCDSYVDRLWQAGDQVCITAVILNPPFFGNSNSTITTVCGSQIQSGKLVD
jgi:hypothetical protein